jgi:hypothetical protein
MNLSTFVILEESYGQGAFQATNHFGLLPVSFPARRFFQNARIFAE